MYCWVCQACFLLVLALIVDQVLAVHKQLILARGWRQADFWWRAHQPISDMGSGRGTERVTVQLGNRRGVHRGNKVADYDYGSYVGFSRLKGKTRRYAKAQSPISVTCNEDHLLVTVQTDLFQTGTLVRSSDFTLGSESCPPGFQSSDDVVVFEVGLQECGNNLQMSRGWLVYSTFLTYNPSPAGYEPIQRANSAVIPIRCSYPRHGTVTSRVLKPTWIPYSSTLSSEEQLSFTLRLMNGDWSGPRDSTVYQLGEMMNIEASLDTEHHSVQKIFADRCVATLSSDVTKSPSYDLISLNGCLLDGKQEDSNSTFRVPRSQPNKLQFTVAAFRFISTNSTRIFITCYMKAVPADTPNDAANKACSFNKESNTWSAVEGPNSICNCCEIGRCDAASEPTNYQYRSNRVERSGPRRKKAESSGSPWDEKQVATLGPLYIVGLENEDLLKKDSQSAEVWMVAGVCSLWVAVLIACTLVCKIKPKKNVNLQ